MRKQVEEEEAERVRLAEAEAERKRKEEEEAAERKRQEEEAAERKRQEEAAAEKKHQEEEAERRRIEEENARIEKENEKFKEPQSFAMEGTFNISPTGEMKLNLKETESASSSTSADALHAVGGGDSSASGGVYNKNEPGYRVQFDGEPDPQEDTADVAELRASLVMELEGMRDMSRVHEHMQKTYQYSAGPPLIQPGANKNGFEGSPIQSPGDMPYFIETPPPHSRGELEDGVNAPIAVPSFLPLPDRAAYVPDEENLYDERRVIGVETSINNVNLERGKLTELHGVDATPFLSSVAKTKLNQDKLYGVVEYRSHKELKQERKRELLRIAKEHPTGCTRRPKTAGEVVTHTQKKVPMSLVFAQNKRTNYKPGLSSTSFQR